MFCPLCKTEYRPGFTRCADCDVELVAELPKEEAVLNSSLVRLWRGTDPILYSALIAALREAHLSFIDNPPTDHGNWLGAGPAESLLYGFASYELQVAETDFAAATEILNSLLAVKRENVEQSESL